MIVSVPTPTGCYQLTTLGSSNPQRLIESHFAESDVRARWWHPKPGDVVLDIGAGCGSYTMHSLTAGATVLAFEPGREEFFDLHTLVMLNRWQDRCHLFNCLVSFKLGANYDYDASTHCCNAFGSVKESRLVQTVDELVESAQLPRLDWLKIDVEGAELDVLNGAKAALDKYHPRVLLENHEGFQEGARIRHADFFFNLESDWEEERYARPELGKNADWSFWTWKE